MGIHINGLLILKKPKKVYREEIPNLSVSRGYVVILEVYPSSIEFVYNQLETNAISFIGGNINYLTISTSVYLEDDEELDSVFFEIDDQINSMYKYPEKVIFYNDKIEITFSDLFIDKYKYINIHVEVTKKITDFFYNHLFLQEYISYNSDFKPENITKE